MMWIKAHLMKTEQIGADELDNPIEQLVEYTAVQCRSHASDGVISSSSSNLLACSKTSSAITAALLDYYLLDFAGCVSACVSACVAGLIVTTEMPSTYSAMSLMPISA